MLNLVMFIFELHYRTPSKKRSTRFLRDRDPEPLRRIGRVEWAVSGRPDKPLKRRFPTAENANG